MTEKVLLSDIKTRSKEPAQHRCRNVYARKSLSFAHKTRSASDEDSELCGRAWRIMSVSWRILSDYVADFVGFVADFVGFVADYVGKCRLY